MYAFALIGPPAHVSPAKWDCRRAGGRCTAPTAHSVGSCPIGGSVVVGGYVWPGDYHDPRYPDPVPLKHGERRTAP